VPSTFEAKLEIGRAAEKLVAAWLKRRGWRILPVYDYSGLDEGKAPKLEAEKAEDSLVTPDLLAARAGVMSWFEVKYKTRADWTRKTKRFETGISLRLWRHYREAQAASGATVWLVFVHEQEDEIRAGALDDLAKVKRDYCDVKMGRGGMAFFPWDSLKRLGKLSDVRRLLGPARPA